MPQYSVLLVDDDVKLVRLLQSYFEKDGFLIYTAHDGLTHSRLYVSASRILWFWI